MFAIQEVINIVNKNLVITVDSISLFEGSVPLLMI